MCDYRSVKRSDEVATDIVFPDYLGETFNFYPDPGHRWYYLAEQKSSEALMIKCFDSATKEDPGIAQCTSHPCARHLLYCGPAVTATQMHHMSPFHSILTGRMRSHGRV
jgi:hypothetical protein